MVTAKYISLRLTDRQREDIRKLIGRDAEALTLTVEELEEHSEPFRLRREEHLHELWVTLGLDD